MSFYPYTLSSARDRDRGDDPSGLQDSPGAPSASLSPSASRARRISAASSSGAGGSSYPEASSADFPPFASSSPSPSFPADRARRGAGDAPWLRSHPTGPSAGATAPSTRGRSLLPPPSLVSSVVCPAAELDRAPNPFSASLGSPGATVSDGDWAEPAAGLGPAPRLPHGVHVLGASSVRSLASTSYDGASSALFYPNVGLYSGAPPTHTSTISAFQTGGQGGGDGATGHAPLWGASADARRTGMSRWGGGRGRSARGAGPETIGRSTALGLGQLADDGDVYFAAGDDVPGTPKSPSDAEPHTYQPPRLASDIPPSTSSADMRGSADGPASHDRFSPSPSSSEMAQSSLFSSFALPSSSSAPWGGLGRDPPHPDNASFTGRARPSAFSSAAADASSFSPFLLSAQRGSAHTDTREAFSPARSRGGAASGRHPSASSLSPPSTPAESALCYVSSEDFSDWYVSWEHPFLKRSPLDVSGGPLPTRRCTDVFFLGLFVLVWLAVAGALILRLAPSPSPLPRLSSGIDWRGRVCGYDEGVEDFPLVYWPAKKQPSAPDDAELSACSVIPVCTKKCPAYFAPAREKGDCPPDAEAAGLCTWYGAAPAALLLRRYCLFVGPDGRAKDHGLLSSWIRWVADLDIAWPVLIAAPTAALVLGYLFMWLLQNAAHLVVAVLVMALELLLIGSSYAFYRAYATSSNSLFSPSTTVPPVYIHPSDPSVLLETARLSGSLLAAQPASWSSPPLSSGSALVACSLSSASGVAHLLGAVACGAAALLVAFCAVFFRHEIQLSTSVLTAAAMLLQQAPPKFLLLLPLVAGAALVSHGALAVGAVSHLLALGPVPTLPVATCIPSLSPWLRLPLLSWSSTALLLALLFVALWTAAFLTATCRMIVAYYASAWYFMPRQMSDRRELLKVKAAEAAKVICWYHLGSAALGGLVLSTVQIMKLTLSWARHRPVRRSQSAWRRCFYRLSNCFASLYAPVKCVTPTAFVFVALLGQPLLQASWTAVATLTRNPVTTAFVWQVGWLLQMICQLSISIIVAWCTYTLLPMIPSIFSQLSSLAPPVLCAFVLSLYVASVSMQIFGLAVDTLLQAFLADREMSLQDGKFTAEHAPAPLRTLGRHMLRNRPSHQRYRR
ncbi:hypothetical protein BESB_047160 [Besnoitia besnoiti]|uniref:Plasma-membrane choline transporter n=1 Tax=Besnoitia besnoiti TaxID=94643 RepID=A0A2A9MH83_BESBE|nr:hypothetical protein BESB_047160 [Besnoitia besnoiti]PFH36524.1 hypothetical protein BESB_047160 [Besnoitia besnoiti]